MPIETIYVYRTIVIDGVATADSELVALQINDANGDGSIGTQEFQNWAIATYGSPNGHTGGTSSTNPDPALWIGDGTGNFTDGILFSTVAYDAGENLQTVLDGLIQNKFSVSIDAIDVCFLAGTMIATPDGDKAVETLRAGDLVMTRDHGPQPLVWVGQSTVDAERLDRNPNLRPIRIEAGALDGNLPRRPLSVSSQHRILMTAKDGTEYLVAARHMQAAGTKGFSVIKDDQPFTLVHISCANHEVIEAEGAATESFYTGPMAVKALRPIQKLSLFAAFPGLAAGDNPMTPARPFLKRKDVAATLGEAAVDA